MVHLEIIVKSVNRKFHRTYAIDDSVIADQLWSMVAADVQKDPNEFQFLYNRHKLDRNKTLFEQGINLFPF